MGLNIDSATTLIATKLQAGLVDPINARTSAWIYTDGARVDLDKTPFPKMLIKKTNQPSDKVQLAIGNQATENTDEIILQVKTEVGKHYTDNVEETDHFATEFAAILAQRAEDFIKLNHDYWVSVGFLDVLAITTPAVIETDKDRNPTFNVKIQMHYISDPNN